MGQKAVIEFNDAEGGIRSDGEAAEALEICDASGVFHPARAIIDKKNGSLIGLERYRSQTDCRALYVQ